MEIKDFIEKAELGGWDGKKVAPDNHCVFLDPLAWEALGKVEGWKDEEDCRLKLGFAWKGHSDKCEECISKGWQRKMRGMIDALIAGDSLKDYVKTL